VTEALSGVPGDDQHPRRGAGRKGACRRRHPMAPAPPAREVIRACLAATPERWQSGSPTPTTDVVAPPIASTCRATR
jgi:hypothetical protein